MIRVGDRLKKERLLKKLTIEEVAKATKIRPSFLQALEEGDYKQLPSSAYIQGFIRNYAEFLELPVQETMAIFRREFDEREFLGVLPESFTQKQKPLPGFRLGPMAIFLTLGVLFILIYVFFQYKSAFFDPSLSINIPKENAITSTQVVTVSGTTDPNTTVTINNVPIYIDKDGNFKKDIAVLTGPTIIVAKAINSFGRKSTVIRHIIVQ